MKIKDIKVYRGRNIYCLKPVIKLNVDLEKLHNTPTVAIQGFNERLLESFPGLSRHQCSLGHEGGFMERLREGTYLGHVTEHTILELQNMLGYDVGYGSTRQEGDTTCYHIVYRYINEQVGIACGKAVVQFITDLSHEKQADIQSALNDLQALAARTDMGPSTRAIYEEAIKRGIPVTRLGGDSQLQFGYGKYARRMEAALTDKPSCIAVNTAGDKHLTKEILQNIGIPVPTGEIAYSLDGALRAAEEIGYPVVIKPYDSNHGNGVSLNVQNRDEIPDAFQEAMQYSTAVIVEKYIQGKDYRVLVVGKKVSAVAERRPPSVLGDGVSTIAQLVEKENENPLRGDDHTKPLTKLKLDDVAVDLLKESGMTPATVPALGTIVKLRENANLSTGGTARSCPDEIHPANAAIAVKAAQALGLDIAGVDICSPDLAVPFHKNHGAIIEVNAGPGLRMHMMPSEGPRTEVGKDILNMLYPPGTPFTIPIVAVTGTNGKTTTTRLIAHTLSMTGRKVGYTTTSGIFLGQSCILEGDNTGAVSAGIILSHPEVEAAVLETARGGIVKRGLGYDLADVGVITNISEDHLGLDDLYTLEDLAYIKSLVVEAVKPWGCAVLNADDPMVEFFLKRVRCNVLFFSKDVENPWVAKHLKAGGNAVYFYQGGIQAHYLGKVTPIAQVDEIPITYQGAAVCNIENAMAASAALLGLGIPEAQIRKGLISFQPDEKNNPGRFNIFEANGYKVMLDYGHNIAGYEQVIQFLQQQEAKRLVGVIGVPGDRQNDAIEKVGELCGRHFHKIYVKEDQDLRGRQPGEVARLLQESAHRAGTNGLEIEMILSEKEALKKAMEDAQPGDFIVAFYEKYDPLKSLILSHIPHASAAGYTACQ